MTESNGSVSLSGQDYLTQVDPTASLGLSSESVLSYQLTHGGRQLIGGEDKPQLQPLRCLGGSSASIYVTLKGEKISLRHRLYLTRIDSHQLFI